MRGISSPAAATRRPFVFFIALLAVASLVAGACGGDDDDEATSSTTEAEGTDTTASESDDSERDPDGVIRMAYDLQGTAAGNFSLDPAAINVSLTNTGLLQAIYGSFMRLDQDGELVPELAESVDLPDENTLVINLREGLTFSDGSPFDAEAVQYGLDRQLTQADPSGLLDGFYTLGSIEVTDPQTVTLNFPDGGSETWRDTYIAEWPTSIVKEGAGFDAEIIGAGPFEVTQYSPQESMTLTKRDDYWDAENILVGGIELTQGTESQAVANALGADQVDMGRIEAAQADALSGGDEFIFTPDPAALVNYQICKNQPPFDNEAARRALQLSTDSQAISDALFGGTYEVAKGIWPAGHPFHDEANEDAITFDLDAAREALEEAGMPDGFEFDAYVIQSGGLPEVAQILQAQWAELGITANLIPADNYVEDFLGANASGIGFIPVMGVPKTAQWVGDSIGNSCGYSDPELDDLAAQIDRVPSSSDEAAELWHQVEAKVVNETLSGLLLFGGTTTGYDTNTIANPAVLPGPIPFPDYRETFVKA